MTGRIPSEKRRRNPLLGAAVVKALLQRRAGDDQKKTISLYEGILRDLGLTDEQFAEAVAYAPQTRPDRYTILEHLDLDTAGVRSAVSRYVAAVGR